MSLQKPYHIKGRDFERAYKDYLSEFRTWKHLKHASKYLIFPRNLGPNVTIDETALSDGELYTIISNHSHTPYEKVWQDSDRNYWMNAEEAKEYGMIDTILTRKK